MLAKVKAFLENKFAFLMDDDFRLAIIEKLRLVSDIAVWPYNYIKSFFK